MDRDFSRQDPTTGTPTPLAEGVDLETRSPELEEPQDVSLRGLGEQPPAPEPAERTGLSHFLRSLLSGIPWSERASVEFEKRFPTPLTGRLELTNPNGRTRILGEDRDDILVRGHKQARAESPSAAAQLLEAIELVGIETASGVLVFESEIPRSWNRHGNIDLEVLVPRDTQVHITSSNGKVCLQGLRHGVRAHSSNGSIRLEDIMGTIELITANAKICCSETDGQLVARSSNGKIDVEGHRGSIDAATSNGLIRAQVVELSGEGLKLATSNGRIVLELPDQPDAEVDIRVDNGVIRNELKMTESVPQRNGRLRGRLGRGGCPIKLRTSNGTISLR